MTTVTYELHVYIKVDGVLREYTDILSELPDGEKMWQSVRWYRYWHEQNGKDTSYVTHVLEKITTTVEREII